MPRHRTLSQRASAWLAVLAMLLMACAPTLTQAFGAERQASWMEVCSTVRTGTVADAAEPVHPVSELPSVQLMDHCPYCSLHADVPALPPSAVLPGLRIDLAEHRPAAFWQAAATAHAWRSAQPRAPPSALR
jgi:Protein of unknown function (DUF2946)